MSNYGLGECTRRTFAFRSCDMDNVERIELFRLEEFEYMYSETKACTYGVSYPIEVLQHLRNGKLA